MKKRHSQPLIAAPTRKTKETTPSRQAKEVVYRVNENGPIEGDQQIEILIKSISLANVPIKRGFA